MVLIGEDVGLGLYPEQLNNEFGFNWILKKVYVGNRRVMPNTDSFTASPDPLLGSFCAINWTRNTDNFALLPSLDFSGNSETSYFVRLSDNPSPGSAYRTYTDRYRCATCPEMLIPSIYYERYTKRMSKLRIKDTDYNPEDPFWMRNIRIPEYHDCYWLHSDTSGDRLAVTGALAYAIVVIPGDYDEFKTQYDAANGFVFTVPTEYTSETSINIVDPVAADQDRTYELMHTGFRTTNKLLSKFTIGTQLYSIVAMKGKLSSQPNRYAAAMSQPYFISTYEHNDGPMPYKVLLLGAEYYGYQY